MKRIWTIKTLGYRPFQMVLMEGPLNQEQALAEARSIWPECEVW